MEITAFRLPPLDTNCYILTNSETGESVVVDAPYDAWAAASETVAKLNSRIVALLLTHGHFDHILDGWKFADAGIRIYANGSVLNNHLDRVSTHAVSVIINLDQDVDEPWPLEIHDHTGRPHNVTIKPGDMVLYESASCIHGRPWPLVGRAFVNVFRHFRPKENWDFKY